MTDKLKVLHINSYYAQAPFYKNLYDAQQEAGIDISVYIPVSDKGYNSTYDYGSYSKIVKTFSEVDRINFYAKHRKILHNIKKMYQISEYDIVHAHSLFSNGYIAYKLHEEYGIPYIVAVRNTDINVFFKYMLHLRKLGISILKNASQIVFLSDSYKTFLLNKYISQDLYAELEKKSIVIPNGVDQFWLNNIRRSVDSTESKTEITILAVGDIDKNKNHMLTARACEVLSEQGYKIKFNIVGRIKNKKIMSKLLRKDFVNYKGTMHKESLLNEYRNSSIFVMPSKTETFGLVYVEAMTQGIPVIYTEGQGFDKQFPEAYVGFHVERNDYHDLADKIKRIYSNYEAFSLNCIKGTDKFRWNKIASEYISNYKRECKK